MKTDKIFFILVLIISGFSYAQVKTAVYWTSPIMSSNAAISMAKNDLVIVDLENLVNNYDCLEQIKKTNPKIKLICYSNPMEFFTQDIGNRPLQVSWTRSLMDNYSPWLLKTGKGQDAIFYPGMRMLNISSTCPRIDQQTYGDWMANYLLTNILNDPIWDGYFLDNGGGNISWLYSGKGDQIDADNDFCPDVDSCLDLAWSDGIRHFLMKIRQAKGSNFILMANKGSVEFMDILDGRMFEGFPCNYLGDKRDGGWHQCLANSQKTGKYTIFQAKNNSMLEFIFASSLLIDNVYVCASQNTPKYYHLDGDLGKPLGPYKATTDKTLFYRDFENGRVEVSPASFTGSILFK